MKVFFAFLLFLPYSLGTSGTELYETSAYKLIVFEGSDWCRNCRRLEKEVLSKPDFASFLKENSIQIEKIDFPQRKKLKKSVREYNDSMAEKYDFEGVFPTMVLVSMNSSEYVVISDYTNQTVADIEALLTSKMETLQ